MVPWNCIGQHPLGHGSTMVPQKAGEAKATCIIMFQIPGLHALGHDPRVGQVAVLIAN